MSEAWVSLVPCNACHGRRGMMLAAAAMAGCFILGVGAGPIPFVTVVVATLSALWIENASVRAAALSRSSLMFVARSTPVERTPQAPAPTPCWEVVEVDGERRVELHWKRD